MIIEYLYIYNKYHKVWIKGPFTQEWLTRYASSCAYSVSKGLLNQINMDKENGELLRNSPISIHAINVPSGMRNFKDTVSEMDEHWFYFYWHAAGNAYAEDCKPRFDYFRDLCLKFSFVEKLPTFEQYKNWSDTWDDTYNGSFNRKVIRYHGFDDSKKDLKFHAQFKWVGLKSKAASTMFKIKRYKLNQNNNPAEVVNG